MNSRQSLASSSSTFGFSSQAVKRVLRELAEVEANPISGIALCMPNKNDPFTLHANLIIADGIYEGILIHLVIHIPQEYPIKPPAVNIAPGLDFGHDLHEHIYDNPQHGNSICTDLTSNFTGHFSQIDSGGKPVKSGWTPAYTLSSVLIQLQVFFADPDRPKHMLPSKEEIAKLKKRINEFEIDIEVNDGSSCEVITHSYDVPYPTLEVIANFSKNNQKNETSEMDIRVLEKDGKKTMVNNHLTSTNLSVSSTRSTTQNSPVSDINHEQLEETKQNNYIISNSESSTSAPPKATHGWDKPLKRVSKTNAVSSNKKPSTTTTVIVKVIKQQPHTQVDSGSIPPQPEVCPPRNQNKKGNFKNNGNRYQEWRQQEGPRVSNAGMNQKWQQHSGSQRSYFNNNRRYDAIRPSQPSNTRTNHNMEETKTSTNTTQPFSISALNADEQKGLGAWVQPLKMSTKNSQIHKSESQQTQTTAVSVTRNNNISSQQTTTSTNTVLCDPVQSIKSNKITPSAKMDTTLFNDKVTSQCGITMQKLTTSQIKKEISTKLICSVSKADVFDASRPILGYPIDLEKDVHGRLWPTPVMEMLSYDSFVFNIQQNFEKLDNYHRVKFTSSFGSQYNYWLPVYINGAHFERSQQYILNAIAIIYAGVEGKAENDFKPAMVLKVLPPILVKTAIHFLKGTIHQSIVGIDTYCQLYRLLMKLVEFLPELQEAIDKEVASFCSSNEHNRHKKVAGDLGEFMIKLSLSSKGIRDSAIINLLFKENLARQVSWTLRKDRQLIYKQNCSNFVQRFMSAAEVSNQFFLVVYETQKLMLNEEVKVALETRCGVLDEETMRVFRMRLNWIQKNIKNDWRVLVESLEQQQYIYTDQVMESYLVKAFDAAQYKGYLAH